MKKQIYFAGVLFIIVIAVWLVLDKAQTKEHKIVTVPKAAETLSKTQKAQLDNPPHLEVTSLQTQKTTSTESLKRAISFESLDPQASQIRIKKKSKVEPISAFSYKQGALKEVKIGDTILMPYTKNIRYELKVTKKTLNSDNSLTIETSVENGNPSNYAIITEAKNTTFVTLKAPEGVYEMEGIGGTGYIYSALEIKRAKIDYSHTDAMIPKAHTHTKHN